MADGAAVFGVEPGADFPRALVDGLRQRLAGQPPEAAARVTVFVNTARMMRRVTELWCAGPAGYLPRFRPIAALAGDPQLVGGTAPATPLRTRLELATLIGRLVAADPRVGAQAAVWDLADSLARLVDEMQGEGVAADRLRGLDVAQHAEHWARSLRFLDVVLPYFADDPLRHPEARQRAAVLALIETWRQAPPQGPVIVAGSTGSRGTTALLMQAVARLPQGCLVLPGFDFLMPAPAWAALDDIATAEDHPQYRFHRLLGALSVAPDAVQRWGDARAPDAARNRLVSLALRPAPVTDQWIAEGPGLPDLAEATRNLTLVEAPSPRMEAAAIAVVLRAAVERGETAALVTPDRTLARQVSAALDRWGIVADDSAGVPLNQTPAGRLLRQVAALLGRPVQPDALVALLKHPLAGTGGERGTHLRHSRDLELWLRRDGPAFVDRAALLLWARKGEGRQGWAESVTGWLDALDLAGARPMAEIVTRHRAAAERVAAGTGPGTGDLWDRAAGEAARAAMDDLATEAPHAGPMAAAEYRPLFDRFIATRAVRAAPGAHPGVRIWGTLEARVQGVDLVVLGGLNEGVWPSAAPTDPWLNRPMRLAAGLLLPERQIGLAAHDFQQAVAAPRAVLTRAVRSDAEATPSRWLNRLVNLMSGLPGRGGPDALEAMRRRGRDWLALARALEQPSAPVPRAARPAPQPPLAVRPRALAVTGITTLIRDPYAIYARHVLGLRPLDPLVRAPDARLRGMVLHQVMERYVRAGGSAPAAERLMAAADAVLAEAVAWPTARLLWRARMARVADWFAAFEAAEAGTPQVLESRGQMVLAELGFTLTARPDRIDLMPDGTAHVIDYKTGTPPSAKAQKHFDKQLPLEAVIAESGGFGTLGRVRVSRITHVGLGASPVARSQTVDRAMLDEVDTGLRRLIAAYGRRAQGYTARRAVAEQRFAGDYDLLARFGEWGQGDAALASDPVGDPDAAAGGGPA
jgi:inactivated superfamily I helicase/RecB family exonuclease